MSWHDATVNSLPPLSWPPAVPEDAVDRVAEPPQALALIEARLPPGRPPPPEGGATMLLWHADPASPAEAEIPLHGGETAVAFVATAELVATGGRPRAISELARRAGAGHALAIAEMAPHADGGLVVASLGIVSPHVLYKLGLERLPGPARPGAVGSSIALLTQLEIDHVPVSLAAVRLAGGDGPDDDTRRLALLLDRIDLYDRHLPVLVAGDLMPLEPMLGLLRQRGYEWAAGNVPDIAAGRAPRARSLCFLWRSLACRELSVPPAAGRDDAVAVRVGRA